MKRALLFALCFLGASHLAWAEEPSDSGTFDWGFIASRSRDVNGIMRLRVLGPFFERASIEDGQRLTAVRPLFSHSADPATERSRHDYLWPLGYDKTFKNERGGRYLIAFWQNFDVTKPHPRYRFWLLPLYFQGRDIHGENYAALFPFGGRIHEFVGRDEISFFAFPLYLRHSVNDVETRSFVWPIYSRTEGEGIDRFSLFPFYGRSTHEDRYNKKFVLWPFWSSAEYFYPGSTGKGYIFFPFWGRIRLDDQRSFMVLPPLFRFTRSERIHAVNAPWPIIQYKSGEINQLYIFPLWGRKELRGVHSRFLLWPIIHEERVDRGRELARRLYVLPFFYSDVQWVRPAIGEPPGRPTARYHKVWPLGSYRREAEAMRFRVPDLWPLKNTPGIERNWAPLWTLFSRVRQEDRVDTELLWGLFRREYRGEQGAHTSIFPLVEWGRDARETDESRSWALLKGLIGYERQGMDKRYQLLYFIRWNRTEESAP